MAHLRLLLALPSLISLLACAVGNGCAARQHTRGPTTGGIFGLVRDKSSGEPLPAARVELAPLAPGVAPALSLDGRGSFERGELTPGTYTLSATYAAQRITVSGIAVERGRMTPVDVAFDLGFDGDIAMTYDELTKQPLARYRLGDGRGTTGKLEIVVESAGEAQRLSQITVFLSAAQLGEPILLQTDAQGRALSPPLQSGIYELSAYYTEVRRGSLEQRKGGIAVSPGEVTVVPFRIEVPGTTKR